MGDLIFKCSGPVRAIEIQVPVSKSITELDAVKKLIARGASTDSDEDDGLTPQKKKKKKAQKSKNDGVKIGASTLGVLLASVILAAMKEE